MTSKINILKINRCLNFPIERVVSILRLELDKKGKFVCPYHQSPIPSMSVVKAKNKCKCMDCGAEATPVDLVKLIMGYTDTDKAVDFLLGYHTPAYPLKQEPSKYPLNEENSKKIEISRTSEILSEFYWEYCVELPKSVRDEINSLKLKNSCFSMEYMGWLKKDPQEILAELNKNWASEDLIESGLVCEKHGKQTLKFNDNMLIFPHFDFRIQFGTEKYGKIVSFISGKTTDTKHLRAEVTTNGKYWIPYNMDKVDMTKKVLLCEGVLNVLTILSHGKIYSPVSISYQYISQEIAELFKNADVTIAFNHEQASVGQSQRHLTDAYNKKNKDISLLFKEATTQNISILKAPIGVELGYYFKRYRTN